MLQKRSSDIVQGIQLIKDVQEQLQEIKESIDEYHKAWLKLVVDMVEEPQSIPRNCGRQTQHSNIEADSPEVYYRRTLTIPFLDHLQKIDFQIMQKHQLLAFAPQCLFEDRWLVKSCAEPGITLEIDLLNPLSLEHELE